MDIIVKGRRTDVNERFRRHVTTKLAKMEKLDQKLIRVDVEVSQERNPRLADRRERVELTIRSRGQVIRAEAAADDRYGAFDVALSKLEARLRRSCDRRKVHYGNHAPAKLAKMAPPVPPVHAHAAVGAGYVDTKLPAAWQDGMWDGGAWEDRTFENGNRAVDDRPLDDRAVGDWTGEDGTEPVYDGQDRVAETSQDDADAHIVPIPMEGDGPLVVREKFHKAEPMAIDQALHEMELVGHDFYVFRDSETGHPSVVYRRRGWDYGVIRLLEK